MNILDLLDDLKSQKMVNHGISVMPDSVAPLDAREVPCGSCHACCQNNEMVILTSYDDWKSYESDLDNRLEPPSRVLKHKPNGDCVYLGDDGCTIHDRQPWICRSFDCRIGALQAKNNPAYLTMMTESGSDSLVEIGKKMAKQYPLIKNDPLARFYARTISNR